MIIHKIRRKCQKLGKTIGTTSGSLCNSTYSITSPSEGSPETLCAAVERFSFFTRFRQLLLIDLARLSKCSHHVSPQHSVVGCPISCAFAVLSQTGTRCGEKPTKRNPSSARAVWRIRPVAQPTPRAMGPPVSRTAADQRTRPSMRTGASEHGSPVMATSVYKAQLRRHIPHRPSVAQ